jgi:hypothetical protein
MLAYDTRVLNQDTTRQTTSESIRKKKAEYGIISASQCSQFTLPKTWASRPMALSPWRAACRSIWK